jgi:hypothetical protein
VTIELPRLRRETKITEGDGVASLEFHRQMQEIIDRIQTSFNDIESILESIQAAQDAAEAAARESARINSYTAPTSVLTAADAGSDASITIAAHTRIYPVQGAYDVEDVQLNAGSITGLSFSTQYWIYYDDETLENTSPTYVATTSIAASQVGAVPGRHFLGSITTPADGAGGTSGTGVSPPGGGVTII